LDEPALLAESIRKKAERTIDIPSDEKDNITCLLSALAAEMFDKGAPVAQSVARQCWGMPLTQPLPTGLFDAALLARMCNAQGFPALDFYYSRERDFAIAMWARRWPERLLSARTALMSELELATQTSAGAEALRWFLQQPDHLNHLRFATEGFTSYQDTALKRLLLSSLCTSVSRHEATESDWIRDIIGHAIRDSESIVRVEAAKLLVILNQEYGDADEIAQMLNSDREVIKGLLSIEEDYPLTRDTVGNIVLRVFEKAHGYDPRTETSEISAALIELLEHNSLTIRSGAAKALGYISPKLFLRLLAEKVRSGELTFREEGKNRVYAGGVDVAVDQLWEACYGYMCPGWLEGAELEERQQEFEELFPIAVPVIGLYWPLECAQSLINMLEDLQSKGYADTGNLVRQEWESVQEAVSFTLSLRYQLRLPFDDLDEVPNGKKP
jgi:hypothetical protein